MTSEQTTPDALEAYIGNFGSPSFGVWWDGQRLVYESFVSGYDERRQVLLSPSRAQWDRFWRTLESIDVWSWNARYEPGERFEPTELTRDGTHWSLSIRHAGRSVDSAGDNAGPDATDLDESARFGAFTEAVSRLAGGRPFG